MKDDGKKDSKKKGIAGNESKAVKIFAKKGKKKAATKEEDDSKEPSKEGSKEGNEGKKKDVKKSRGEKENKKKGTGPSEEAAINGLAEAEERSAPKKRKTWHGWSKGAKNESKAVKIFSKKGRKKQPGKRKKKTGESKKEVDSKRSTEKTDNKSTEQPSQHGGAGQQQQAAGKEDEFKFPPLVESDKSEKTDLEELRRDEPSPLADPEIQEALRRRLARRAKSI